MICVIIPIYNEEKILKENSNWFKSLSSQSELIFVDGGSTDRSVDLASYYSNVLSCKKCRATQMNYAAQYAKSNKLLFLHADTTITLDTLLSIERRLENNCTIGGCLTQRINKKGSLYRIIETQGNIRARLSKVFYGDQGIFVKKDIFSKIGGFPEVPIMEDVIFTKKLRRKGKTKVLSDKIAVSARRWEKKGIINTALLYSFINILFWINVPLNKIRLLYDDLR